jgi:hypothetical protein
MQIRKFKYGDEKQILKLDRLVETHRWNRRNLKNWYWKYNGNNPFGKAMIWVAEENKKVVATFSAIPLDYNINGKTVKGSCSIAMIVHPTYQNKGLIKFVADKLFEDAKFNKIKFIYGYPNQNAYQIHKKFFSYEDVSVQKMFYKKIKKNISILRKRNFDFIEVKKFPNEINKFLLRVRNQHKVYLKRNLNFLNWRYIERPDYKYKVFIVKKEKKIFGYFVLKIYIEGKIIRGHIIDCFYDKKIDIFDEIINFSEEFFFKKNCNEMTMWLQGDDIANKKLKKLRFSIAGQRPMICKFLDVNKNKKKYLNEKYWFFTMGDTLEIY